MEIYISYSPEDTYRAAYNTASGLHPGDVVALCGDLGAGKTVFIKGIAEYFGCAEEVSSPTYTLVNRYDGTETIYHFDVYRIERPDQQTAEWIDEYLFGDGICLIEWADNIKDLLPENTVRIEIVKNPEKGEDFREIRIC